MTISPFSDATSELVARTRRHSLGDLLHRTAVRLPSKLGIVDGERRMTFAEFDEAVGRAARALADRGLRKGDRVALLSHNCWQYAVLVYATARVGIVLVPVNFMLGAEEIAFILGHCDASGIIAEDALVSTAAKACELAPRTGPLRARIALGGDHRTEVGWDDVDAWCLDGPGDPPDVEVGDDDPIRLMYTSGTESRPKGVMLSSRSLINQYVSCVVEGSMSADDVDLHSLPLYHCAQLDCFLAVDVYVGATSIIVPRPDPAVLLSTIARERVSKLFCPPTVWISMLRHPDFDSTDLSSLRKGYYGASAMPVEVLRELTTRLPDMSFWNFYGQTEMAPAATILGPAEQASRPGSAGRPALTVETRIVDDEDRPLPPGEVGEIVHRSPHASLGYFRDEDKTAAAFRGGWFHSGDLGVMSDDGYLSVVDRKKDMIKTGGENVASREVEEAVYEVDGVAEAAVFGIDHPVWIEAVTAVIVPTTEGALTTEAVRRHLEARLAGYKRPKYLVLAEALPKNPSGKILKRELREAYAHLAADAATAAVSTS